MLSGSWAVMDDTANGLDWKVLQLAWSGVYWTKAGGGEGNGGGGKGEGGDGEGEGGEIVQPDTSISSRRKESEAPFVRLPSKRIALVSTGAGRMNVVSWPFCVSPVAVCDQLVCASTVVHADVVKLCTCSSKPVSGPSQ